MNGRLERLALAPVVVPADLDVEETVRGGVHPGEPRDELAREEDETGAGGEHRETAFHPLPEGVPEAALDEETRDRGGLAAGHEQRADLGELGRRAHRHHVIAPNDRPERREMLGDIALERENSDLHFPARSSSMIAFARSNRTWWSFTRRSTTRSTSSGRAPALTARLRACNSMWPRWIPSVARARSAAKFWASPTEASTSPSSRADFTPSTLTFAFAVGWTAVAPPMRPTGAGISIVPTRFPSLSFSYVVRGRTMACPSAAFHAA